MLLADPPVNPIDWTPIWSLGQSLLVGLVAVVGTVLGVIVTDRRAAARAREERRDARRVEVRQVATDLVETGPAVANAAARFATAKAATPDGSALPVDEVKTIELQFDAARQAHLRAIAKFLLTVKDEEPTRLVRELRTTLDELPKYTGPLIASGFINKPPSLEQIMAVMTFATDYGNKARDLQDRLAPHLAEYLVADDGRG